MKITQTHYVVVDEEGNIYKPPTSLLNGLYPTMTKAEGHRRDLINEVVRLMTRLEERQQGHSPLYEQHKENLRKKQLLKVVPVRLMPV